VGGKKRIPYSAHHVSAGTSDIRFSRLAIESPGSYHHSMVLAQMCEEAASAIGANRILARLGAMYHDIGKTKQPQYFMRIILKPTTCWLALPKFSCHTFVSC